MTTTVYSFGSYYIFGDTEGFRDTLDGKARQQVIDGIDGFDNTIYGDAYVLTGTKGGNDILTGGNGSQRNAIFGDSEEMSNSLGGNDALIGGDGCTQNILCGDALNMLNSKGGNDALIGGNDTPYNDVYGDANYMIDSQGGNDLLIGGDVVAGTAFSRSMLYGDAAYVSGTIVCGNDHLVSGTGNDQMWGDVAGYFDSENEIGQIKENLITFGHDTFVFYADNGQDTINDFQKGKDTIQLHGIAGAESFDALADNVVVGTDTVISFGSNTITVVGVTNLSAEDFYFA